MSLPISDNEILNSFNTLAEYFPYFFDDDISIAITDKENFIMDKINPKLPIKATTGNKVPDGGAINEALKTGKNIIKNVPEKVYGVPFRSYAIPIKNEYGEVSGCIVLGKSLTRKKELTGIAKTLTSSFDQISSSINNVSSGVQEVVDMNSEVLNKVQEAEANSKDTDGILNFIQGIAAQTNMLGLNAAIEASRAGEAGRGFKVVATEIRKLSTSTSESVKKVDSVLKNIGVTIRSINEKASKSNGVFEDEAATLLKIAAAIEELNSTAHKLEELAEKI